MSEQIFIVRQQSARRVATKRVEEDIVEIKLSVGLR